MSSESRQLDLFDSAKGAYTEAFDKCLALARERFIAGFDTYGTAAFSKPRADLFRDMREEIADLIAYAAMLQIRIEMMEEADREDHSSPPGR